MKSRSTLILKNLKVINLITWFGVLLIIQAFLPDRVSGRIYIDINAPSIQRIQIAIPDFKNFSENREQMELSSTLPGVISNDLDLSGYFTPMDKGAFLEEKDSPITGKDIRFKDWSVIGTELLLKGEYTCIGRSLEVEIRLYDVFWGRQVMGKRVLGKIDEHRALMHRLGNEIILLLTGRKGMFLSKLAFVGTSTGNKEIYVSDYDGHNVQQITSDKSIALFPRFSPSGDKIIFSSYKDGGAMLYLKDRGSDKVKRISARKGLNIGASWAPDGKRVALTLSHGDNPDIYTIDLKGKIIDHIINHWGDDLSPSFSPEGNEMVFVSNRSGSPQIYLRDMVQGKEERLTFEGKYNTNPVWSKLNQIAFSGLDNGQFDIYTIDSRGGNLRRLTEDQGKNEDPCWSPDGKYIVFSSNREGGYHLYIMNANGQNQRRITFLKGEQTSPSWSPY